VPSSALFRQRGATLPQHRLFPVHLPIRRRRAGARIVEELRHNRTPSAPAGRRTRKAKTPSRNSGGRLHVIAYECSTHPPPAAARAAQDRHPRHVDTQVHLVGRLFHDTGSCPRPTGAAQTGRRAPPRPFDGQLMTASAERDQNISIDTAQIWFHTQQRRYVIMTRRPQGVHQKW